MIGILRSLFVSDKAGAISTFGAGEMGKNKLINVQNVLLWPSHPPRPRKLAPWAAKSWRLLHLRLVPTLELGVTAPEPQPLGSAFCHGGVSIAWRARMVLQD